VKVTCFLYRGQYWDTSENGRVRVAVIPFTSAAWLVYQRQSDVWTASDSCTKNDPLDHSKRVEESPQSRASNSGRSQNHWASMAPSHSDTHNAQWAEEELVLKLKMGWFSQTLGKWIKCLWKLSALCYSASNQEYSRLFSKKETSQNCGLDDTDVICMARCRIYQSPQLLFFSLIRAWSPSATYCGKWLTTTKLFGQVGPHPWPIVLTVTQPDFLKREFHTQSFSRAEN
jgi:hypothetical protein